MKQDLKSMTLAELQDGVRGARRTQIPRKAGLHMAAPRRGRASTSYDESLQAAARKAGRPVFHHRADASPASRSRSLTGRSNISGSCVTATAWNRSSCSITTAIPSASRLRSAARWAASSVRLRSAASSGRLDAVRTARPGALFTAGFRPAHLQYRADGHRRTAGQF